MEYKSRNDVLFHYAYTYFNSSCSNNGLNNNFLKGKSFQLATFFYIILKCVIIWINNTEVDANNIFIEYKRHIGFILTFWYGCLGGIVSHYLKFNDINIMINSTRKVIAVEILT